MKKFIHILSLLTLVIAVSATASVPSDNIKSIDQVETVAVQGSAVDGLPDQTVAPGLSLDNGFQNPITVTDGGRMNLTSGESIVLKPGTRVIAGGYLRANILSDTRAQKSSIHQYRKAKKTVGSENTVEPVIIAETQNTISPFARNSARAIRESSNNEESLNAIISDVSGISPEQNRKTLGYSTTRINFTYNNITNLPKYSLLSLSENRETTAVLRL
jgi:hypothetical protein